ncbi:hypothetical protein V8F20_010622 [Naviculisporaceae sp. PSN 640]
MTNPNVAGKGTVRWVGQDTRTGLPQKRRQAVKACSICRKSKKRCSHVPIPAGGSHDDTSSLSITTPRASLERASTLSPDATALPLTSPIHSPARHASLDADASVAASQLLRIHEQGQAHVAGPSTAMGEADAPDKAAPFLGELNPEGIFVEATLTNNAIIISPDKDVITSPGIWIEGTANSRSTSPRIVRLQNTITSHATSSSEKSRKAGKGLTVTADDLESFVSLTQQFIVSERGALVRATDEAWEAIKRIYLHKVNPILPIFDEAILGAPRSGSLIRCLVEASVCLAVAADSEAEPYLVLQKKQGSGSRRGQRVSYQEYSQAVVDFIQIGVVELRTSEPQEHVLDCVSILALTSFFWQPGPHARFSPMDLFGMLTSMVHTYGIHLMGAAGARAPFRTNDNKRPSRLFRCLYAIDRLISAFYARPVMFHNYDVLISLKPHEGDTPSFKLFMSLTTHLDQIIELYRPRPTIQQSDIDFPIFERLIMEAGAQQEPDHILGTLEVLYHAISILSVRMPRSKFRSPYELDELLGCVSYSHLPPNRANARRSLSADRIVETIRDYKLSPMPFVPYALALSLSVQYRKWRFSRTPMFRARAKTAFEKIVPILGELGKVWTSARITSSLGAEVIKQLNKTYESAAGRSGEQGEQMDLDIPQELQTSAPATTVMSPPTDLPTPAASLTHQSPIIADKGKDPAKARSPYAISTLLDSSGPSTAVPQQQPQPDQQTQSQPPAASHPNPPQEQSDGDLPGSTGFSSMLGGMQDDGLLAGFDWTLANTLDPCYYASSYYWAPFQGGVVDEAGTSAPLGFHN